ncbi:MAG TPA: four helix bundle protein [Tepidisphaeraceae bacterium]|nr:four helix bundle protein [Tepidisphaeraceae bacterium]
MVASSTFRDLIVWQKAHAFTLMTYEFTSRFPREEMFGLISQFRRAAISIAANITEGFKRVGKADKLRFYNTAQSSLEECRYYLILAKDLKYGDTNRCDNLLEEVSRLLVGYMNGIKRRSESD